ncbi:proteinase inhibitor i78 [Phenylobacterium montanum]|nr:proteinase inhibitor i78 [Caulobacter sp. S6]
MRRFLLIALAAASLAACRDDDKAPTADAGPKPLMPNIASTAQVKEQCDAHDLAWLVGKPHTQIPVAVDPSRRRVACSTCQMPEDYRPDRTNIIFDSQTGLVMSVTCG